MIQNQGKRNARRELLERVERVDPGHHQGQNREHGTVMRKMGHRDEGINIRDKVKKKKNKIEPLALVPTRIEEVPIRRQDKRNINALLKRRTDKHLLVCIILSSLLLILLGVSSLVVWILFSKDISELGPLIILGPVITFIGLLLLFSIWEICSRLKKQKKRALETYDKSLHELKHWIEPDLIEYGWGQYDLEEEARYADAQGLRIR